MCKNEEERGMKEGGVFFVEFYLAFEIISRIIEGIDFVHPEGFLVKGIKPQDKPYKKTEDEDEKFFIFSFIHC